MKRITVNPELSAVLGEQQASVELYDESGSLLGRFEPFSPAREPAEGERWDPRELRKLSPERRDAVMREAAEQAEADYREGVE